MKLASASSFADDFFKDFDKHNDGTLTQAQFIKRLNVAYDKITVPPKPKPTAKSYGGAKPKRGGR